NLDLGAGRKVAALGGFATRYGEIAETDETNVTAVLEFALDRLENGVDSRCCVRLGQAGLLSHCGYEFILVHVSTPFLRFETTLSSRGQNTHHLSPRKKISAESPEKPGFTHDFQRKRPAPRPVF